MRYIATAFIFYKNKLLFVLHKKSGLWMHVGGHVEANENIEEALLREIKEEINIPVVVLDTLNLKTKRTNLVRPLKHPFFIHQGTHLVRGKYTAFDYVCIAKSTKIKLKEDELLDYKWVSKSEIKKLKAYKYLKDLAIKAFEYYKTQKE